MMATLQEMQTEYSGPILEEIRSVLSIPTITVPDLRHIIAYQLGLSDDGKVSPVASHGKMLRSLVCVMVCQAAGGDPRNAVPAAAALELIHNFSLIHDDIQDQSPERRHRPAVWKKWGIAQAITAGDAMYALACWSLTRLRTREVSSELMISVMTNVFEACLTIAEGQYLDLQLEKRQHVGVDEYLGMAQRKTGSLIACAARVGALLAQSDGGVADTYARFGEKVGLAFQIVDDVLGIWGAEAATGKPVGEDIARGKKSLPVVYALEQGESRLTGIYRKDSISPEDVRDVTTILDKMGAKEYALRLARGYCAEGLKALQETRCAQDSMEQLRDLAQLALERDY